MNAKELTTFVFHIKSIYRDWKKKQEQSSKEMELANELDRVHLPKAAAYHMGIAIELANNLGIELYRGTGYTDCRAVFLREKWKYDYRDPDEMFDYGQWTVVPYKDVKDIQALSTNICFAISKCALWAKQAGVI